MSTPSESSANPVPPAPPDLSHDLAAVRAERDDWRGRALEAERIAEQLALELAGVRTGAAEELGLVVAPPPVEDRDGQVRRGLAADSTSPEVLSLGLAGVGLVAGMVTVLSLVNNGLFSVFSVVMIVITGALAWFAWQTRPGKLRVSVLRSVVLIEAMGETYRFDLASDATQLEVVGTPGESDWAVRFPRTGRDPLVVDDSVVGPTSFMATLRQHRPDL